MDGVCPQFCWWRHHLPYLFIVQTRGLYMCTHNTNSGEIQSGIEKVYWLECWHCSHGHNILRKHIVLEWSCAWHLHTHLPMMASWAYSWSFHELKCCSWRLHKHGAWFGYALPSGTKKDRKGGFRAAIRLFWYLGPHLVRIGPKKWAFSHPLMKYREIC